MKFMSKEERSWHAMLLWDTLIDMAKNRTTRTYEQVSKSHLQGVELKVSDVDWALGSIQEYCKSKGLPRLVGLVVDSTTQKPTFAKTENDNGYHGKEETWEEERDEVFDHPWDNHPNPGYHEFMNHAR